jgi:hypothetical protein
MSSSRTSGVEACPVSPRKERPAHASGTSSFHRDCYAIRPVQANRWMRVTVRFASKCSSDYESCIPSPVSAAHSATSECSEPAVSSNCYQPARLVLTV